MKRGYRLTLTAALLLASTPALAGKDKKVEHLYGPAPDWSQFRRIAEADIAARLIDPESARISWLAGYFKGEWKPFLSARIAGYVACGTVNARNRMGGFAGAVSFAIVIDYDRVLYAELDGRAGGIIAASCNKALAEGMLPPLPANTETAAPTAATSGATSTSASGMTLRAMPDGAYVSAVALGTPAASSSLTPGMVITSVNAIPLAGMGDAMLKVVEAAGNNAMLTLVGGKTVTLRNRP